MKYDYSETVDYLVDWYDYNARILPWRDNPKPYYVWISEIMLQQTRVEAVKDYFERFIGALKDIEALAHVPDEKLMKLWEGLGYYNRARNLKKTANILVEEYNKELPADYSKLLNLPGIGSYTAGAIASIAFHIPEPAVDGNVLRVMKRVAGSFDDITKSMVKKELEEDLRAIIPKDRPGDFNQAIMELGATVCIPNGKPLCDKCPIIHLCRAFHTGNEMNIPVKTAKKPRKVEERTILLIESNGEFLLKKRENKGLLAGLWELPGLEGNLSTKELELKLSDLGILDYELKRLDHGKYIFSHIEWRMIGYYIKLKSQINVEPFQDSDIVWADRKCITDKYSVPSAFETYLKYILS